MNARLNNILTTLAQQYDFALLQNAPTDEGRIYYLADKLADYGVLVITANIPINSYNFLTKTWMDNYYNLYTVFAKNLFPSTGDGITFALVDELRPPVALMQAKSTAVIQIMAGYVVPYIAMCQETSKISSPEIRGLLAYILEDLESSNIERAKYNRITNNGEEFIKRLIALPFQQHTLTTMKKPLFQQTVQPQVMPNYPLMPAPPIVATGPLDSNKVTKAMSERPTMPETGPLFVPNISRSISERPKTTPETGPLDPNTLTRATSERPKTTPETGPLDPKKAVKPKTSDTQSLPRLNFGNRGDTERTLPIRRLPKDDDDDD